MNYIVSGHGGRYVEPTHYVWVPDGYTVVFFVEDGQILLDDDAWPIYNDLLAGSEDSVQGKIVATHGAGDQVYNYSCWPYPELGNDSGIFEVGGSTDRPIIDLNQYTGENPLTLGRLFGQLPQPGVIYWVACTEAS